MALSAKLQIRQTQSLIITPQLMQAIRLLQMSGVELDRFVAEELEQNPLLEADERAGPDEADSGGEPSSTEAAAPDGELDAEPGDLSHAQTGSDFGSALAPVTRSLGSAGASLDDIGLD